MNIIRILYKKHNFAIFNDQDDITKQVTQLLSLKEEFKKMSGQDWKPTDAALTQV